MTCLNCEIAAARRENAILRVPRLVPNPKWLARKAQALAEGMSAPEADAFADKIRWSEQVRAPSGKYEPKRMVVVVPREVPNPKLDDATGLALRLPSMCDAHAQLRSLAEANASMKIQAMAEEADAVAKDIERRTGRVIERRLLFPKGIPQKLRYGPEMARGEGMLVSKALVTAPRVMTTRRSLSRVGGLDGAEAVRRQRDGAHTCSPSPAGICKSCGARVEARP